MIIFVKNTQDMKKIALWLTIIAAIVSAVSCKDSERKPLLPSISGKAGEVLIVINKESWEDNVGTELRELLASDCPYLPQKEPLYTLINITPGAFTDIFQIHRNILLVNIDSGVTKPGVIFRNDVWSSPQCFIGINAPDNETAYNLIKENEAKILTTLEQAERDRVVANSIKYEEISLRPAMSKLTGGILHFPGGYTLKKQTDDFLWVSYDTQYTTQGVLVFKYPASGTEADFCADTLMTKSNEYMKANVPGMFENTYMTISTAVAPDVQYIKYRGREFAQMRGLWEVYNDYMGGPFVSHAFYSQDGKEIIVLEAFVYAPRYDKRHYLRQIESVLYSFEWDNNRTKK